MREAGATAKVLARSTGYLVSVDGDALLACAERRCMLVELLPQIGDFVTSFAVLNTTLGSAKYPWTSLILGDFFNSLLSSRKIPNCQYVVREWFRLCKMWYGAALHGKGEPWLLRDELLPCR